MKLILTEGDFGLRLAECHQVRFTPNARVLLPLPLAAGDGVATLWGCEGF